MDELKVLSEVVQYIKVEMGDETFGIDISYVDNILRMQRITRVLAGRNQLAHDLRGEIVPIMNLRLKMGLEEVEETKATRIIIVKMDQIGKLGFIVDCVKEVISLEEEQMESIIHDSKDETTHFVNAVGKVGDSIISLLDLNTVVLDKAVREDNA